MKTLLIVAVTSMTISGTSFISAPQRIKEQAPTVSSSQTHDFSYFRSHKQGKSNVVLSWGVTSLEGVAGFAIERSYDGDFYDVVNQMARNGELKQSWKDENVFPGYIYYRIACVMDDGTVHYSQVESIRIVQRG